MVLDLTDEQVERVRAVLSKHPEPLREIDADLTRDQIETVVTSDEWVTRLWWGAQV